MDKVNFISSGLTLQIWIAIIFIVLLLSFCVWVSLSFNKKHQIKAAQKRVDKYFGFLYERGFEVQRVDYFPRVGGWAIILVSKDCKIRIINDRGGIYCELAPILANDKKYLGIYDIVTEIEKQPQNIKISQVKHDVNSQLDFYGKLLYSYYDQIISFIKSQPT